MKDAFGVEKSFVTGVGFKPITQMNKLEIDALRTARSMRAQGGRGHLGQLIGGEGKPRVTPQDAQRAKDVTATMESGRHVVRSKWWRKQAGYKETMGQRPINSSTAHAVYRDSKHMPTTAASYQPLGGKMPQRQVPRLIKVNDELASRSKRLRASVINHEMAHADVRKPMSAFVRHQDNRVKARGDEARADHAMEPAARKGLYRTASMSRNPFKRRSAQKQLGDYAGKTKEERKQAYRKYKEITRKLEGMERA
jgi:hypothetical protein